MKKKDLLIIFLVFVGLIGFVMLLKRGDVIGPGKANEIKRTRKVELNLKKLEIIPEEPTSSDAVRARATLAKPTRARYTYTYRWFVDGKEIHGQEKSVLSKDFFRKNSKIYCRAKAVLGTYESKERKSDTKKILNSAPIIRRSPVENFEVPGLFTYKVTAHDPDGDNIKYQLVAPLGKGVELDPLTGELTWDIPAIPEPPKLESQGFEEGEGAVEEQDSSYNLADYTRQLIVIEVIDSDGATARISIRLDLAQGREITL